MAIALEGGEVKGAAAQVGESRHTLGPRLAPRRIRVAVDQRHVDLPPRREHPQRGGEEGAEHGRVGGDGGGQPLGTAHVREVEGDRVIRPGQARSATPSATASAAAAAAAAATPAADGGAGGLSLDILSLDILSLDICCV